MSWRDRIEVHPAADLFPMMSDGELKELTADIAENGQQVGVILWTPERAEDVGPRKGPGKIYLLDGRNRLEAISRAFSDEDEIEAAVDAALSWDWRDGGTAKLLYGDDNPFEIVVSANIRRRHLTAGQTREIIAELLKMNPERSDLATAKIAGVSHPTVAKVRAELEASGDVEKLSTRTDTAGRQQPARKPAKIVRLPTQNAQPPRVPVPPARDPLNDVEIIERQVDALMRAWNAAGPEARETFLDRIDRPTFDTTRAGRQ